MGRATPRLVRAFLVAAPIAILLTWAWGAAGASAEAVESPSDLSASIRADVDARVDAATRRVDEIGEAAPTTRARVASARANFAEHDDTRAVPTTAGEPVGPDGTVNQEPEVAAAVVSPPSATQCNGTDNVGGQAVACDVQVVNNLDLATGETSSTTTVEECHGAANAPATVTCTTTVTPSDELVTSVDQCNGSGNGGGGTVNCNVSITNNISGAATPVPATVNQCNTSGQDGGTEPTTNCDPSPASTTDATVEQCNESGNGGGGTERVRCTVASDATQTSALPVTVDQCNGSGNGGGGDVECTVSITNNITAGPPAPPSDPPSDDPPGGTPTWPPVVFPPGVTSPVGMPPTGPTPPAPSPVASPLAPPGAGTTLPAGTPAPVIRVNSSSPANSHVQSGVAAVVRAPGHAGLARTGSDASIALVGFVLLISGASFARIAGEGPPSLRRCQAK